MTRRSRSFLLLLAVYLTAILAGGAAFLLLPGTVVLRALLADLAMTLVVFLASLLLSNASVYDPYWSVQPHVLLLFAAVAAGRLTPVLAVLLLPLSVWAVRLTANWASLWTDFTAQDWRYEMIRAKAPRLWPWSSLVGIMLFPTLIVFSQLAGAFTLATVDAPPSPLAYAGALAILAGACLQWFADRQMASFRIRNRGRNACIDEGVWRYSRHPNYFGEITVWWGVFLIVASVHGFFPYVLAPLAMTGMFVFISIPMMERRILSTRPHYAAYQKRVSILIPFFPEKTIPREVESK